MKLPIVKVFGHKMHLLDDGGGLGVVLRVGLIHDLLLGNSVSCCLFVIDFVVGRSVINPSCRLTTLAECVAVGTLVTHGLGTRLAIGESVLWKSASAIIAWHPIWS